MKKTFEELKPGDFFSNPEGDPKELWLKIEHAGIEHNCVHISSGKLDIVENKQIVNFCESFFSASLNM